MIRAMSGVRLMALLPLFGSGCMGTHLYSASDHQLATSAQTAFTNVKLSESLKAERAVLDSVLAREIAVVRRQSTAQRDTRLRLIIGHTSTSSWKLFEDNVAKEFEQYIEKVDQPATADSVDRVKSLITAESDILLLQRSLESNIDGYRLVKGARDPELICPRTDDGTPSNQFAKVAFDKYQQDCAKYVTAQQIIASIGTGELGEENKLIADIEKAQAVQKAAIQALDTSYAHAKKAYTDASAKRDGSELAALKTLHQQLARLDSLQSRASALDKQFGELKLAGPIASLEKQQESIDKVLDALLADSANIGKPPAASTKGEIAVLEWIAALHRDNYAATYPDIGALLLERESVRLRLDAAKKSHDNALARLALLRQKRDLLLSEVTNLNKAKNALATITPVVCARTEPLSAAFETGSARCRELIATALLAYANAWTLGHMPRNEIDYRINATRHSAVLDASENALAQWESLIKIPIDNLVAFHASGTKAQDIAALLNALGLGALAATR